MTAARHQASRKKAIHDEPASICRVIPVLAIDLLRLWRRYGSLFTTRERFTYLDCCPPRSQARSPAEMDRNRLDRRSLDVAAGMESGLEPNRSVPRCRRVLRIASRALDPQALDFFTVSGRI
jgi:hypothetical protein